MRVRPTRPRPTHVAIIALLLLPLAGCGLLGGEGPDTVAGEFLAAIERQETAAAGGFTDAPGAARQTLDDTFASLAPQGVTATVDQVEADGDQATASYTATWSLGNGRDWNYQGSFRLDRADGDWRVSWSPSVLHPQLADGQELVLREVPPAATPVLDRAGAPLLTPQDVIVVRLDPATPNLPVVAGDLAAAVAPVAPGVTQESILRGAEQTPDGQGYVVVTLREQAYNSVRGGVEGLTGVELSRHRRLLAPDSTFASQLVPGLRTEVQRLLAGVAGWRVVTVDAAGNDVATLAEEPPGEPPTVTTTVDSSVQAAAEAAVEPEPTAAMMVVLQASTGEVVAVAQNGPADGAGAVALTGRYPPGSTFKIVTAAAALRSSDLTIDTPVACPPTTTIDGRRIPNLNEFGLGTVPLRTAFARSCNTTFAQLAADFEPAQLTNAARTLGVGADFDIAGITTITGSVPEADSRVQRAANGFGQGTVLTSPFGMALASATVAAGEMPTPVLIRGSQTPVTNAPEQPLPPEVTRQVQGMMRAVVTEGTASALAGHGALHGKTGTAESPTGSHGWFVGYRGDLAFATLVVDAGSSDPAVAATGRFLEQVGPR